MTGPSDSSVQVEALKPCPHCGAELIANTNQDDFYVRRYGTHYKHPANDCLLSDCEITPSARAAWNRRAALPGADLMESYRALQNTLLVVPDGKFKNDMDDWLSAKLAGAAIERRAALPVAPSDEQATSSLDRYGRIGLLQTPEHWKEACRLFRARCSAEDCQDMAKLRTYIEEGLLVAVRPALLEQATRALPVAALSDADRELMEQEIDALEDLTETIEMGDPHWADAKCFKAAVAAIAALRTRLLRHSEGKE